MQFQVVIVNDEQEHSLSLTYRIDPRSEGVNRIALAKVIGRLQLVRKLLDDITWEMPNRNITRSREELAAIALSLAKLKSRL